MRISDWSSDVCSSDLLVKHARGSVKSRPWTASEHIRAGVMANAGRGETQRHNTAPAGAGRCNSRSDRGDRFRMQLRSEEHTSELQSLMRISYAVFCLKKKTQLKNRTFSRNSNTRYE